MTFKELQDAVIYQAFKEAERTPYVKMWLNVRMARIWTAFDWSFRHVEPVSIDTIASNAHLGAAGAANLLPADFLEVDELFNDSGTPLEGLPLAEFYARYQGAFVQGSRGRPEAYTVVNKRIIVGPAPDRVYTYALGYKRLLVHDDGAGNAVVGLMTLDADKPYWPEEHHELLVPGAKALGFALAGDPRAKDASGEHDDLVAGMVDDGLILDEGSAIARHYARDPL